MRIAYLILAHKNVNQLKRLVKILHTEDTSFFIHLDKKVKNASDYFEIANDGSNIYFINKRVAVNWGAYSMIQATLNSLQEILDTGIYYDYINLLSGQDYPIKKNTEIFDFLTKNYGKEFLYYAPFPTTDLSLGGMDRVEYYYNLDNPDNSTYESEMKLRGLKRKFIQGMDPYHGSQWWSLTGQCVKYVLDQVKTNKEISNFYRYSMFSDEQFFQTIIMNSKFDRSVVNDNLRYIDWSKVIWEKDIWIVNPPHPKTLTTDDLPSLVSSSKLFARKFEDTTDVHVLDMLDRL